MKDICDKFTPRLRVRRGDRVRPAPARSRACRRLRQAALGIAAAVLLPTMTAVAASAATPASAANPPSLAASTTASADQPFADHHLVLQLSDRDAAKQAMVLSVAYNLLKEYGPDRIAIEVVAFGPGIDLLRASSDNRVRVDSLVAQGVRFSVCMNTVETVERETGKTVALNPNAQKVQAGVARILVLAEGGYTLVRP